MVTSIKALRLHCQMFYKDKLIRCSYNQELPDTLMVFLVQGTSLAIDDELFYKPKKLVQFCSTSADCYRFTLPDTNSVGMQLKIPKTYRNACSWALEHQDLLTVKQLGFPSDVLSPTTLCQAYKGVAVNADNTLGCYDILVMQTDDEEVGEQLKKQCDFYKTSEDGRTEYYKCYMKKRITRALRQTQEQLFTIHKLLIRHLLLLATDRGINYEVQTEASQRLREMTALMYPDYTIGQIMVEIGGIFD